jgi:hypothetical protein
MGQNLGLGTEKPVTNHLSYGMVLASRVLSEFFSFPLLTIIPKLPHTRLSSPYEMSNNPD